MEFGISVYDLAIFPLALQHFGSSSHRSCIGVRAQIANTAVQVNFASWIDADQTMPAVARDVFAALADVIPPTC